MLLLCYIQSVCMESNDLYLYSADLILEFFLFHSETKGVTVHKDSKFYQSWQNFKENNAYLNSK